MARHALLIGVSEFADKRLNRLNAPINDVLSLRRVLQDPARGAFDSVDLSLNEDFLAIRDRLTRFFDNRAPDDLLLLYYSGHGILGRGNRLFLATSGSNIDAPRERSIAAKDIQELIEDSRSERQVIVLDCCHSGAFSEHAKAAAPAPAVTTDTFSSGEAGIYVLTAADALQFAWDGEDLRAGEAASQMSRFTGWLVDGLERGEAAPDDEQITMDALYRYLFRRARGEGASSTPQRFVHGGVGDPVISRNPLAGTDRLDPALRAALIEQDYRVRLGAVTELVQQMRGADRATSRAARLLLERHLEQETHVRVHRAISDALEATAPGPGAKPDPVQVTPEPPLQTAASGTGQTQAVNPATTFTLGGVKVHVCGAPGAAGATMVATAAGTLSSISEDWRALSWWAKPSLALFWPLGIVWLLKYRRVGLPRWMTVTFIILWVLIAIAAIGVNSSNPP